MSSASFSTTSAGGSSWRWGGSSGWSGGSSKASRACPWAASRPTAFPWTCPGGGGGGGGVCGGGGGLERLVGGIIESFARVPVGGFATDRVPLDLLVGVLASGFELAIRVAAPVTGIVLLLVIVIGVMGKTMP